MTDKQSTDEPQQVYVPVNAHTAPDPEKPEEKEAKEGGKKKDGEGAPVGQIAAGGVGATVLGSYALASAVGPWGWAAAPAVAAAGGAGYAVHRYRKKRGAKSERRTEKVTTSKGSTSSGRLGGLGGLGGSRASSPASGGGRSGSGSSGTRGSSARHASGGSGSGGGSKGGGAARGSSARPGGGSSRPSSGGSRPGSSSPRGGASPRGSSPRGGSTPRTSSGRGSSNPGGKPGGLFGRGSGGRGRPGSTGGSDGVTSKKGKSGTPDTSSGRGPKAGAGGTRGGSMPKNRWGTGSTDDPNSKQPGRFRRGAARARDWADDKTGRRASTGWRAARGQTGFANRRRAAGQAVKDAGGGGIVAGIIGLFAALFAGTAALAGRAKPWADKQLDSVDPDAKTNDRDEAPDEKPAATGSGSGGQPQPTSKDRPEPESGPKTENQPDQAPTGAPTGGTMSGLPAAQIAHDMAGAMSRYEPADAYQIVPDSRQWADVPHQVALSVKAYADRLEGARFPINQAINEKLREFAQAMAATRSIAEELEPLMRKAHEDDLARQESPRGDESKWNI